MLIARCTVTSRISGWYIRTGITVLTTGVGGIVRSVAHLVVARAGGVARTTSGIGGLRVGRRIRSGGGRVGGGHRGGGFAALV